jgi:ketosteroid isomerase-like protein
MDIRSLLLDFCSAVEQHDGERLARLFCEDGVYHDVFYGAFAGRERIAEMIDRLFYKDAEDFRWNMVDPVFDGQMLYARYLFSFRSLLPEAQRARVMFEGVAIMKIRDHHIAEYREVANVAPAFTDLNFAPQRILKILGRQNAELKNRRELTRHLK